MRILLLGTDRNIFTKGSAVRERIAHLGTKYFDALDSIIFSTCRLGIRHAEELSATVHAYPTNSFSRLLYGLNAYRIARTLVRPDVVSAQDPFETGLAAWCIARYFRVPLVVEMHTDFLSPSFARHSLLNRLRVGIASFVLPRAAASYAVSEKVRTSVLEKYHLRAPISTLPIFVDLSRFRSIVRAPKKGELLWIGRFEKEKNPFLALQALAGVRRAGIDARLTMLGEGGLKESLERVARNLGIAQHVTFPGWVAVEAFLARTELLLVTSEYEGYGMALVEALAARVPVLATDVGVAREAGAHIASRKDYIAELETMLRGGLSPSVLAIRPYENEEEYFASVRSCYEAVAERFGKAIH